MKRNEMYKTMQIMERRNNRCFNTIQDGKGAKTPRWRKIHKAGFETERFMLCVIIEGYRYHGLI